MNQDFLEIEVKNSQGQSVQLRQHLGDWIVLYFYPKDFTPGCTTEACSFRDANTQIEQLGAKVIGVSKDSPASHQKFLETHHLNFELWSDEKAELMKACGAIGEKTMFGKKFVGVKRITLIIDPSGNVAKTYKTVKPAEHAEQVLRFLKSKIK